MKALLLALVLFSVIVGCTGSKELPLNEAPELIIDAPYFQRIIPGQRDGVKTMVLHLPCQMTLENYAVDSVYFMGYHESLKDYKSGKAMGYRAKMIMDDNRQEMVAPYEIANNEALISYIDSSQMKRYFKVSNITEKEALYMP